MIEVKVKNVVNEATGEVEEVIVNEEEVAAYLAESEKGIEEAEVIAPENFLEHTRSRIAERRKQLGK